MQGRQHEIEARVWSWQGRLGLGVECYGDAGPEELARYAERLRATAELALILAEIQP